jgi:UDP-3-O-[3-hydroxymyristoyl] glucosamine N-acyltransferase
MEFKASEIAALIGGTIEGDPNIKVSKICRIEEGEPGGLSFLANPKYTSYIYNTQASIIIVSKEFTPESDIKPTLIRVENAYSSFAMILEAYNKNKLNITGISKNSSIAESAKIGKDVYIGDFVSIGNNVKIGDNVKIFANTFIGDNVTIGDECVFYTGVKIYDSNIIGKQCTFHAGVVIGSDGFGFAPQEDNHYKKVSQIGNVVVGNNVEIGANTTIDRATIGSTIIGKGVKLDNLIQIAHNVEIGENTVIAAQTGIAGSTKIGKNCIIAAQVGIVGHNKIGDNVTIGAQSGVPSDVKDNSIILGSPAIDVASCRKAYVHFRNFDKIVKRLEELEKKLDN